MDLMRRERSIAIRDMERKENDFGVVNECDDMGLGEQVILSDKKSNITMQSRLMSIPVTV